MSAFSVPLSSVLFIISAYGYTMAILGLLAGYISAKFKVQTVLYLSAVLSFVGLLGRALLLDFQEFLFSAILAAVSYPLAVAPVGSIAESLFKGRSQTVVGITVGLLFLGMSLGSFLGPLIYSHVGLSGTLWITAVLALFALVWILTGTKGYPIHYTRSLKGSFNIGMVKNWYVGLAVASVSVLFGSVASTVLLLHGFPEGAAISLGGLLGGLTFLGSALGAMVLPPLFEIYGKRRLGLITSGMLTTLSAVIMVVSMVYITDQFLMFAGYFLFGFFGNAYWSMALASTTYYVNDPAEAGLATSMYSVTANVGVALIPVFLGSLFGSTSTIGIGAVIVIIMEVIAGLMSFSLRTVKVNN
ncbi:MFS transporter [Stygiolobus caldivivus]|uniref:Major facilitator superfamily (MFS) profile domain-containing protein n=1 Tax=Stygiolobus caldivivus TaxID=2824673 RepID=A0A8D5U5M9_9CREN|nr:MFS transporter [Stygiolobus caldivivus]BCU69941.1 hypothetical protein KN1_12380 [Stygiolobus caldivivus]